MNVVLDKTAHGDLFSWLHDEQIHRLVEKADAVCKSFPHMFDQDESGIPSDLAANAMSDMLELIQVLNVFKAVQLQLNTLSTAE